MKKCNALADVMPTTVEGAIALLTYVGKNETYGNEIFSDAERHVTLAANMATFLRQLTQL